MIMEKPVFHRQIPFLPVANLKATIKYYTTKLGFSNEWFWEDSDAGCGRDELFMLFTLSSDLHKAIMESETPFEITWIVESVDAIYEEYAAKKLEIISTPEDKPWGMREFTLIDINGYHLRISQPLNNVE
jgi:uncharacterized glyoxalase superfamily protein PhnB